jgi:hypothetical protein
VIVGAGRGNRCRTQLGQAARASKIRLAPGSSLGDAAW